MTYLIYNPLANNMTGEVLKDEAQKTTTTKKKHNDEKTIDS